MKVFPQRTRKAFDRSEALRTFTRRLALLLVFVSVFVFFFKIVFF